MSIMRSVKTPDKNEEGLVAIIVATIIMIILSLITLGFARLMEREQRQALDRSLSTQAFYAAESGVNDVEKAIRAGTLKTDRDKCDPSVGIAGDNVFTGTIDAGLTSQYSCLLVLQHPPTLEYTNGSINVNSSKIVAVSDAVGDSISQIKFSWTGSDLTVGTPLDCTIAFPSFGSWPHDTGMLRVDVVPADPPLTRAGLISGAITLFLYPTAAGCGTDTVTYAANSSDNTKGSIVAVNCLNSSPPFADGRKYACEIGITMAAAEQKHLYYLRMRSVYKPSEVSVRLFNSANTQVSIKDAQVQVDSTGRVADVIRRIQVRIPIKITFPVPDDALETTNSICKLIGVAPPSPPSLGCPN